MFRQKIPDFCLCRSSPNQFQHQAHTCTCTNLLIHFYLKATIQLFENCKISILQPSDTLYMYLYANFVLPAAKHVSGSRQMFNTKRTGFRTRHTDWIISYSPDGTGWLYTIQPIESLSINEHFPYWKVTKATSPSYDDIWVYFSVYLILYCLHAF